MEEMKPCPFCGNNKVDLSKYGYWERIDDGERKWVDVYLPLCMTEGCIANNIRAEDEEQRDGPPFGYPSEEEAIKAWNTRPIENYRDSMNYEEMTKVVELAHKYGWNGVENSKFLSTFFEDLLNELIDLRGH